MNTDKFCPVCETNSLVSIAHSKEVTYKEHKAILTTLLRSRCESCGSIVVNADQARHNKRAITAFHKKFDGLLTGSEVKAVRKKLSLTQAQAALLFGGGPVAFSKYENDEVAQSESMDKLLRLSVNSREALMLLAKDAGIPIGYEVDEAYESIGVIEYTRKRHVHNSDVRVFFERIGATVMPDAPKFVRINSNVLNSTINDSNYYETQSATGQ